MGFVADAVGNFVGAFTGGTAADAAESAGVTLEGAAQAGISDIRNVQGAQLGGVRQGFGQAQSALQPFTQAGAGQLGQLSQGLNTVQGDLEGIRGLVTDPNKQASFVQDNPFFNALADDAQRRIFGSQAAKGKLGAGGTAEALQNSLLLLGSDLVGQNIDQRQGLVQSGLGLNTQRGNLAQLGASTAGQQANLFGQQGITTAGILGGNAASIADIRLQGAGASASADIAGASAGQQGISNLISAGALALALSDERFKENITHVADVNGTPWYLYSYKGSKKLEFGTMAHKVPHAVINMGGKKYVDYSKVA